MKLSHRRQFLHLAAGAAALPFASYVAKAQSYPFSTLVAAIQYIRAGTLRPLAVCAATRAEVLPDVPAVAEFVPGYDATIWFGLAAPRGTPAEIIEKLNKEVGESVANAAMKARFAQLGDTMFSSSPVEFASLIAADTEKWAKVIRAAGVKAERRAGRNSAAYRAIGRSPAVK